MSDQEPEVVLSEEQIQAKVAELAEQISEDFAGEEILLIGVLKGAFMFLADLTRKLTIPHQVDFISVSSYGESTTSSGAVRLIMDARDDIKGRNVIIVEDIVDTGYTLNYLIRNFSALSPRALKTCALVQKPDCIQEEVTLDYLGFDIPNVWVVGYGLDWAERYRTLPFIGKVEPTEDPS